MDAFPFQKNSGLIPGVILLHKYSNGHCTSIFSVWLNKTNGILALRDKKPRLEIDGTRTTRSADRRK